MTITVSWKLWQTEVKDTRPIAERLARDTSNPHFLDIDPRDATGYWRIVAPKTKVSWPVMIFTEADVEKNPNGVTAFTIGANKMNTGEHVAEWAGFMGKSWNKCVAVSLDDYKQAVSTGFWPDKLPARKMPIEEILGISIPTEGGGNMAPLS